MDGNFGLIVENERDLRTAVWLMRTYKLSGDDMQFWVGEVTKTGRRPYISNVCKEIGIVLPSAAVLSEVNLS